MLRLKPLRSLEVVLATSAAYELFEWAVAVTLAPDMAEAYNGQQGDIWDPHKDMTLALLGAVVAVVVQAIAKRRKRADVQVKVGDAGMRPEPATAQRARR